MTLTDGVLDAETFEAIRMAAERERTRSAYSWISPAWALKLVDRVETQDRTISKLEKVVVQAAEAGIDSFLEYRDSHGYDEDEARAKALLEVGEGARAIREIEEYEADRAEDVVLREGFDRG